MQVLKQVNALFCCVKTRSDEAFNILFLWLLAAEFLVTNMALYVTEIQQKFSKFKALFNFLLSLNPFCVQPNAIKRHSWIGLCDSRTSTDGLLKEYHVVIPCRETVAVIPVLENRRDMRNLFVVGNEKLEKPFSAHFKIKGMWYCSFFFALLWNKMLAIIARFFGLYSGLFAKLVFVRICKITVLGFIVSDIVSIKGMANVAG